MFFIDKKSLIRRRDVLFLRVLPTIVVFVAFLVITLISLTTTKNTIKEEQLQVLQQRNNDTASYIKQRMDAYEDMLRGSAGLFEASEVVTRAEWSNYLKVYDIQNRYNGIQGVGYSKVILPEELKAHTDSVRAEGFLNYQVFPSSPRDLYTSIVYIEPFSGKNLKAFGYDMFSDPNRREAMEKARDEGKPVISSLVSLVQEDGEEDKQPGFLMYLPIYKKNTNPQNLDERRKNLEGYVHAPFRTHDLINSTLSKDHDDQYSLQIFNRTANKRELVYQSPNFETNDSTPDKQKLSAELVLPGTTWEIIGLSTVEIVSPSTRNRPMSVLWGGFVFSFIVAAFIYMLLYNRSRALAEKEEKGIQNAKDELLALASHQLRTPATGVKQYIGMLKEGFAGKLNPTQKRLINKAYDSNERQLSTINEMLFVARSGSGELKIDNDKININKLVRDISDEQKNAVKQRNQKQIIKLPKGSLYVIGDPQYLRMALENIVSNATKYTDEGGRIKISLTSTAKNIILSVSDTGVGVGPKDQPLLFKKFSRIPNDLTNQVGGSGIGLYLAKNVINSHKGTIKLDSELGKGSTVTITLPKAKSQTKTK